jgi:hypothetical protein
MKKKLAFENEQIYKKIVMIVCIFQYYYFPYYLWHLNSHYQ